MATHEAGLLVVGQTLASYISFADPNQHLAIIIVLHLLSLLSRSSAFTIAIHFCLSSLLVYLSMLCASLTLVPIVPRLLSPSLV